MKDEVAEIVEVTESIEVKAVDDTVIVDTDKSSDTLAKEEKVNVKEVLLNSYKNEDELTTLPDNPKRKRKRNKLEALVDEYGDLYPKEKRFCVTSDGQVFFERDKNMAQYHQSSLGEGVLQIVDVVR